MKPEYVRSVTTRVHVRSVTGQLGRASAGGGGSGGGEGGDAGVAAAPAVAAAGEGENQRDVRGKSRKQAKKVGLAGRVE